KYYKNTAQAKANDYLEQAYYYSGLIFWKKKDYDQAIEYLKSALDIRKSSADTHSWLGKAYLDKGLIDEAINSFNEALKYDPRFADAHFGLGQAYEKKNDKDKAIAAYKEALKINPDSRMAKEALDRLIGGGKK
ncbi:MAG: tetratricopeptide repeat protein, partial [Actinomycetota bacterium]